MEISRPEKSAVVDPRTFTWLARLKTSAMRVRDGPRWKAKILASRMSKELKGLE
jgi:hypothetical protein